MTTIPRRRGPAVAAAVICLLVLCIARPAGAQTAPAALRSRMDAFIAALRGRAPMETIASYFPRHSAWEMVETPEKATAGAPVGRQRFAPEHTLAAIREGGPVCGSFGGVRGDVGAMSGQLVAQAQAQRAPWRYTGRGRFVPLERGAGSPVFVEWVREDGTWVISRIGEEVWTIPEDFDMEPEPQITRSRTAGDDLPPERRFATTASWYNDNLSIYLGGRSYHRFGLPRVLADSDLQRFGTVGVVPVFVERGFRGTPEILYVLIGPRDYQPYQSFTHSICRS